MLDLFIPPNTSLSVKYAPDVYIDSIEYHGNLLKVLFHIEDSKENNVIKWSENQYFIDNSYVFISCGSQTYKKLVKNLLKKDFFRHLEYSDTALFDVTDVTDVEVSAYVGNDEVKGPTVTEKILTSGSIENSFYTDSYSFYNKIKDFTLFNETTSSINERRRSSSLATEDLYISYAPNKQINVASVINLNKILLNNSKHYKFLSLNEDFRQKIVKNWPFIESQSKVFIKNISIDGSDYIDSGADIKIYRLSDDQPDGDYLVTWTIKESQGISTNKYDIKLSLLINDYAQQFYRDNIHITLEKSINFLQNYINRYQYYNNKEEFFQLEYENYAIDLAEAVETLSSLYSFKTNLDKNRYYSLFLSILHPLTCNKAELDLVLSKARELENYFYTKFSKNITDKQTGVTQNLSGYIDYIKEYTGTNINGINIHDIIDFTYDDGYGYDVISPDNYDIRYSEQYSGLKVLTNDERDIRYRLETIKYYGSYEPTVAKRMKHLSISSVDIGNDSYNLLNDYITTPYNSLLLRLNDYNSKNYGYRDAENYYFQLLDSGVYVKSIGEKRNDSYNNLIKSVLFDQNTDSRDNSLKYISDTGIGDLYLVSDTSNFLDIISSSIEQKSSSISDSGYKPYFILNEEVKSKPIENKAKIIFYYNTFFEDELMFEGNNYSLYRLKDSGFISPVIKKKLKLYNEYYILEKQENNKSNNEFKPPYEFAEEILVNIPPKYMNRQTSEQETLIKVEDL